MTARDRTLAETRNSSAYQRRAILTDMAIAICPPLSHQGRPLRPQENGDPILRCNMVAYARRGRSPTMANNEHPALLIKEGVAAWNVRRQR